MTWEFTDFFWQFLSISSRARMYQSFWHYYTFLTVLRIFIFFDIFWHFLTVFDIFLTFFDILLTVFDIFLTDRTTDQQTNRPTYIQNLDVEAPARSLKKWRFNCFQIPKSWTNTATQYNISKDISQIFERFSVT